VAGDGEAGWSRRYGSAVTDRRPGRRASQYAPGRLMPFASATIARHAGPQLFRPFQLEPP